MSPQRTRRAIAICRYSISPNRDASVHSVSYKAKGDGPSHDRVFYYDYTCNNISCIHLYLCKEYEIKAFLRTRTHSVQGILPDESVR